MPMNEAKVREIHGADDLSKYKHRELRQADAWVEHWALARLKQHLRASGMTKVMQDYIYLMARCTYGSVETDDFLVACHCYPEWMHRRD